MSAAVMILTVMGCNSSAVDPDMPGAGPSQSEIVVLNSLSKTIRYFYLKLIRELLAQCLLYPRRQACH